MDTNRMCNINQHGNDLLYMAGRPDIRQVRRHKGWNKSISYDQRQWRMKSYMFKIHYGIWVMMALTCIVAGMLFRGQQDIVKERAKIQGEISIIGEMDLVQLSTVVVK